MVRSVVATCGKGLGRIKRVRTRLPARDNLTRTKLAIRQALFEEIGSYASVRHEPDPSVSAFMARRGAKKLAEVPATTPDEIVYAGGAPIWLGKADAGSARAAVRRRVRSEGKPPIGFLVKGQGLFLAGSDREISVAGEVLSAALTVRTYSAGLGGPSALTPRQRRFITEWEAESFRQKLAGGASAGPLEGRVSVVSGAGSGLGRSVAAGLARAGAHVALADVDLRAAKAAAAAMAEELPGSSVLPIRCDVTSESEVDAAYDAVVDRWGGLDILVNAAGIAPAFDLVDLPADLWRKTLDINLTGYFLMARAAARVMTQQGMGGSIVNLSSKSGLEASRTNTPYNATKAGEIHMARGWALELGKHGIRVNSVAPGNVFEGSKIWNPKYIRTCARKYGIRPDQVIPYYVGKTALGREIRGQDVADAVVFLCSDGARTITGQTVVPDGGQVMVR
jgi:NAD(P)-dependent dehydrogenase (short-subunit alcohol dehydrogenase family)